MKDEDKKWLLEEFPKHRGKTIRGEVLQAYYRAEMVLSGKEKINKRTCGCQLRGMAVSVDNSYSKWVSNQNDV